MNINYYRKLESRLKMFSMEDLLKLYEEKVILPRFDKLGRQKFRLENPGVPFPRHIKTSREYYVWAIEALKVMINSQKQEITKSISNQPCP